MFLLAALRAVSPGVDRVASKITRYHYKYNNEILSPLVLGILVLVFMMSKLFTWARRFIDLVKSILFYAPLMSELLLYLLQHLHTHAEEVCDAETK